MMKSTAGPGSSAAARLLIAALLLALPSCAPKRAEIELDTAAVPAGRLVSLVAAKQQQLTSLVGSGSISFESPAIAGSAFFDVSLKKPDSLLARFEGPFGIDVGTFFLSRQQFVMYNSMENTITTGAPSSGAIRSVVPFNLTYDQILNAFSGLFTIAEPLDALAGYAVDEGQFHLTFRSGENLSSYWVDSENLCVTRREVHDAEGRVLLEASASRFTQENGVFAPRHIVVAFPDENRQLSISYTSIHVNSTETSFAYTIPANARRISR